MRPGRWEGLGELWLIVESAALDHIRRIFRARKMDETLAEDVMHELYVTCARRIIAACARPRFQAPPGSATTCAAWPAILA